VSAVRPGTVRRAAARAVLCAALLAAPAAAQQGPRPTPRPEAPARTPEAAAQTPATAAPQPAKQPTPTRPGAMLRGLDKFSGRVTDLDADLGVTIAYQRLKVTVRACDETPEGPAAYLTITDAERPAQIAFAGWMFAANPALSALDHPRYDVWLIACNTASGDAS